MDLTEKTRSLESEEFLLEDMEKELESDVLDTFFLGNKIFELIEKLLRGIKNV